MDRKSKLIHAAGRSYAAKEMRQYFGFDQWESDPEIRKDEIDFTLAASDLRNADGELPQLVHPAYTLDLCGTWQLSSPSAPAGEGGPGFAAVDRIPAEVPGSVHTACTVQGILKDPYVGLNDAEAMAFSGREWTYERSFIYEGSGEAVRLSFDGVCDRCEVYLNDMLLGSHQGMFGGPVFDVTSVVRKGENRLRVHLLPAVHFTKTVVFNCSDGWHYARLWPLGIWNKVRIEDLPDADCGSPFISTFDSVQGTMELSLPVTVRRGRLEDYTVRAIAAPKNFEGTAYGFDCPARERLYVRFDLPEFRLWYPNGRGPQNLYTLYVQILEKASGRVVCGRASSFGVRSLEMAPFPSGEKETQYNRTAVINREGIFLKGANWCTIDAMMRFDRADYDRILSRARQQGLNFFRAWGGGLAETDAFYDLCDEYGLCVYQEWPCCWDSQKQQPKDALYECVRLNTIRMRNHPSLILYGGGNEGNGAIEDEALNRIGCLTYEYDGTRSYFRQDGGASGEGMVHDHIHWGGEKPEHYMTRYGFSNEKNMHEYGLDAFMNLSSVRRYASLAEMLEWPVRSRGVISYHTATFNGAHGWSPTPHGFDMETYVHYASMFTPVNNLAQLAAGSQLAQALAKVPAILNARIKWPNCTANVYYKMNDIYPGGAWSVVDWYGAPKLAHYLCQDAQMPLMAGGWMDRYNTYDKPEHDLNVPVYILDDNLLLDGKQWCVTVRLYGAALQLLKEKQYRGRGSVGKSGMAGLFHADAGLMENGPQFIVFDLSVEEKHAARYYMPMNFDRAPGCLFRMPHAVLTMEKVDGGSEEGAERIAAYEETQCRLPEVCCFARHGTGKKALLVRNASDLPAVGVHFLCSQNEDTFVCSDNYFWLMPGEGRLVYVSDWQDVSGVGCFNYEGIDCELRLAQPQEETKKILELSGASEDCSSVTLHWRKLPQAAADILAYSISVDGQEAAVVPAVSGDGSETRSWTVRGLRESRTYTFRLGVIDGQCRLYPASSDVPVTVQEDKERPVALYAYMRGEDLVEILFSKALDPASADAPAAYRIEGGTVLSAAVRPEAPERVLLRVSMAPGCGTPNGKLLEIRGVTDDTKHRNRMEDTQCEVFGRLTEADFSMCGGIRRVRTAFSIGDSARIRFQVRSNPENKTHRVLLAKCPKQAREHFELYLRPDGELCMYSMRGDVGLGLNADTAGGWLDVELRFRGMSAVLYSDGREIRAMHDAVTRDIVMGDLTLCALNDGGLPFDGEIRNLELQSWCPENL